MAKKKQTPPVPDKPKTEAGLMGDLNLSKKNSKNSHNSSK
jgi:hypothetical protein